MLHQIRTRRFSWLVIFAVVSTIVMLGNVAGMPIAVAEAPAKAQIDFVAPVSVEDAIKMARQHDLAVVQIQHLFSVGNQTFTGFYPVSSNSDPEEVRSGLLEGYHAFVQDVSDTAKEINTSDFSDPVARAALSEQIVAFEQARADVSGIELKVDGMIVRGSLSIINALQDVSPLIMQVEVDRQEKSVLPQSAWIHPEFWAPDGGYISTYPSSYGGRYNQHWMYWDNTSGFYSSATYEHDFFLNNSNGSWLGPGTYLDRSQYNSGIPRVSYAASSLPRAYLDTRSGDSRYEIAYTIGSAKADDISTYTWYINYIRTRDGDAYRDNGKLTAQLGHRSPSWCYSTWCSYGDQNERILPAWQVPAPGGLSWEH